MSSFGAKLREYRERLGMSQVTLAERGGLTASYLNRIEKETRKPPQAETVLRMIEALHLTRAEAEELAQLAGYSPLILEGSSRLTYDSPTIPVTPYDKLRATLDNLPSHRQQQCVDAIISLIEALTSPDSQSPYAAAETDHYE